MLKKVSGPQVCTAWCTPQDHRNWGPDTSMKRQTLKRPNIMVKQLESRKMDACIRVTFSVLSEVRDAGGVYNIYHSAEPFSYIFSLLMLWPDIGLSLKPLVILSFLPVTLICCAHNIVNKDPFTRFFNLQLMKKIVKIWTINALNFFRNFSNCRNFISFGKILFNKSCDFFPDFSISVHPS